LLPVFWCFRRLLSPLFVKLMIALHLFFFSSRRRHTRSKRDWSSDVCSSDLSFFPHHFDPKNRKSPLDSQLCSGDPLISVLHKFRSEERRVGKECRYWWAPDH